MKFKKFSYEDLEKVHLSYLREIGRIIGVKAPAALPKHELINGIIAIQNGEIVPEPPTTRGAPPKIKLDLTEFMANYNENEVEETVRSCSRLICIVGSDGSECS